MKIKRKETNLKEVVKQYPDIKINPPNICEQTKKEMAAFFMKTSWPRLCAKMHQGTLKGKSEEVDSESTDSRE